MGLMLLSQTESATVGRAWPWRLAAALLILGAAALRLAFLVNDCPLDLAPDEAHYWDWSRNLDWSYYSKGPLVAWMIHAGRALLGEWSERLVASQMLAVRLPAVLCGSLLLAALYALTVQVHRSERLALAVVALALTLPLVSAGSSIMTIDSPYAACWGWALVVGHHAVFGGRRWAWPLAGLLVGLGILAKYTMVLWLPALGFFLLAAPQYRRLLLRPGPWVAGGVAALCCLPILVWNVQNDWVTYRHVEHLTQVRSPWTWSGPLVYVGVQGALLLGFWFVAWAVAMAAHRPGVETDGGKLYLWWMSATVFGVFFAFSVKTGGGEPNWPVTAYISGLVLAAGWLAAQLRSPSLLWRRAVGVGLVSVCVIGLVACIVMHRSDLLYPALARLSGPPTETRPTPIRNFDPTARLRGWRTLAAEVDRVRDELAVVGEPVVVGTSWVLPGELGFYCRGNPTVYTIGPVIWDRRSQYDLWRPNPIANGDAFLGRTFVIVAVGTKKLPLDAAFTRVEDPLPVTHCVAGQPIAVWSVTVAHGFRGFERLPWYGRVQAHY
jgi:hypothetical protein